jgi:hypothetical protein
LVRRRQRGQNLPPDPIIRYRTRRDSDTERARLLPAEDPLESILLGPSPPPSYDAVASSRHHDEVLADAIRLLDAAPRRWGPDLQVYQRASAPTETITLNQFATEPPPLSSSLTNENVRPIDPFFPVDLDSVDLESSSPPSLP